MQLGNRKKWKLWFGVAITFFCYACSSLQKSNVRHSHHHESKPLAPGADFSLWPTNLVLIIGGIFLVILFYKIFKSKAKPAKYVSANGYVVLSEGNELEHRQIAKQILGRNLEQSEIVHHINGKRTDNEIGNLCVMNSEKHEHFHAWLRWKKDKIGTYPTINHQKRVLEQEYGGTLLEKLILLKRTRPQHLK